MSQAPSETQESLTLEAAIAIEAPPGRVWSILTGDPGRWWPPMAVRANAAGPRACEPWIGGRVFENWGGGDGLLWGTVIACQRERFLEVAGDLPPECGGPGRVHLTLRLEQAGGATRLAAVLALTGPRVRGQRERLEAPWVLLLTEELKRQAELDTGTTRAFDGECG